MGKKWLPLESNPEVLNDFVSKLGYDTSKYSFCDVFGLDEVRLFFRFADRKPLLFLGVELLVDWLRRNCYKWCPSQLWLCCSCFQ